MDITDFKRDTDHDLIALVDRLARVETLYSNIEKMLNDYIDNARGLHEGIAAQLDRVKEELVVIPSTHSDEHEFLRAWMAREKRRIEIMDKVAGWAVIAVVGTIGSFVWRYVGLAFTKISG